MVLSLSSGAQKSGAKTGLLVPMPVAAILRWTIPLAGVLAECSPSNKTSGNKRINRYYGHCTRAIDAYSKGLKYGTNSFTARVYKEHRQVVD